MLNKIAIQKHLDKLLKIISAKNDFCTGHQGCNQFIQSKIQGISLQSENYYCFKKK